MIGLIGAMFLCGIVIGCMTLTRMGDVVGRKPIYMLGVVMHIGVMCGLILSKNAYFDFLLVFLFGMSVTARYYVGYAYNLEMQPKSHYVLVSTSMFLIESVVYITICLYFWLVQGPWQLL
jgi:MFS family permease